MLCGLFPQHLGFLDRRGARTAPRPRGSGGGRRACVTPGVSRVRIAFAGEWFGGTVTSFCAPWFHVDYDDGNSAEYAGHELAPLLEFSEEDFCDPRRWHYDFSVMHPMDIPAYRRALFSFVGGFGFDLPAAWGAPRSRAEISAVPADAGEPASEPAGVEVFLAAEAAHLAGLVGGFLGTARAERTFANLRNPAIKLIWFLASRGCALPPTANEVAAYYAKVAEISNTVGGVAMAKSALSMLCEFNDVSTVAYSSMRVNAALESMRRSHRHHVRKAAGLTVDMVAAILAGYCFVRPGRPAELQ